MRHRSPTTVYIAMGSNLGDRAASIHAAVDALGKIDGVTIKLVSPILEYDSVGGPPDAPPYLNAVIQIETTLGSHDLLHHLLEIEKKLGRVRDVKWQPRTIDLDLLLYDDQIISSQELVVPHPLMHERRFVLEPLSRIAPQAVHPVLQMTVAGLLEDLLRREQAGS